MLRERDLQKIWYGDQPASAGLQALALVYRAVTRARRLAYAAHLLPRERLPVPVVVVGNLTAGGTGKTPLTIALAGALAARGFRPGIIVRGYGGSARSPMRVLAQSDPAVVGDEACLLERASGVPVAIGANRAAAGRLLAEAATIDVLIADDGLQHYKLMRNVEICVIDGMRRFGNGRLLPAGPLRETVDRLDRVDFRICNGGTPAPGEIAMQLAGDRALPLLGNASACPLVDFADRRVHAVAAIGNPARFFAQLRSAGLDPIEHAFDDHHVFTPAQIRFADELPVLMTDKDAVKCLAFADVRHWRVPVRAIVPDSFFDAVAARIRGQ